MTDVQVIRADERSRYELVADGEVAGFADYTQADGAVRLTHTEIDPRHGGKGYGSKLADAAIADIRGQGKEVVAACEFIAAYMKKKAAPPPV